MCPAVCRRSRSTGLLPDACPGAEPSGASLPGGLWKWSRQVARRWPRWAVALACSGLLTFLSLGIYANHGSENHVDGLQHGPDGEATLPLGGGRRGGGSRQERSGRAQGSVRGAGGHPHYVWLQKQALLGRRSRKDGTEAWLQFDNPAMISPCAMSAPTQSPLGRPSPQSNGYLVIHTSGGLNQMRTGICDAVAVAKLLNATLIVPQLDEDSWWNDKSALEDIFNVSHLIATLSPDPPVLPSLPAHVLPATVRSKLVPRYSTPDYYVQTVLPLLRQRGALALTKFDYRLANDDVPLPLQQLRCRANYHALQATDQIKGLASKILRRLEKKAKGAGFIALHLRFEPDMLAFSGCRYNVTKGDEAVFNKLRSRWPNLKDLDPDAERRKGKCPLTPQESGLFLTALGFRDDTIIYVASGDIHGGAASLAPLRALFPRLETKSSVLKAKELKALDGFATRRAAVDFEVCVGAEVFATNYRWGNMATMVAGHRRYNGHKMTILPSAKRVAEIFEAATTKGPWGKPPAPKDGQSTRGAVNATMDSWAAFSAAVRRVQKGHMGEPRQPGASVGPGGVLTTVAGEKKRTSFYYEPRECLCVGVQHGDNAVATE